MALDTNNGIVSGRTGICMTNSARDNMSQTETEPGQAEQRGVWFEIVSFFKTLVTIFVLAFSIRITLVEPFKIPSGSMIPTLQIGDFILVLKCWYGVQLPWVTESPAMWNTPERGDVVVFTRPDDPNTPNEDDSDIYLIKRVIGTEGDTVEVRGAQLYLNGSPVEESYARWSAGGAFGGNFGPATIPQGRILLLGDNRDNSKDSRFWTEPFLDVRRVKGKAVLVFWSWDSFKRIFTAIR